MTIRRVTEVMPKLHLAGAMVGGVQACSECGVILTDDEGAAFTEGELVARSGRVSEVVTVQESAAYEPCRKQA
mgnify:CR=1 FL=1